MCPTEDRSVQQSVSFETSQPDALSWNTLYICLPFLLVLSFASFAPRNFSIGNRHINAPVVGPKGFLARWYFYKNARRYIEQGYNQFKGSLFKLSGQDIVVLPARYVDELRSLPDKQLSSIQANIDNFEGLHSTTSLLLEGNLHTRTIQKCLTPKLATLIPASQDTLEGALAEFLVEADNGSITTIPAFEFVLKTVSRIASRHFVGAPMCDTQEWLDTALAYTENAFRTIIVLRIFPDWLKPLVSLVIPYSYKVTAALRNAKKLIVPVVLARREAEASDPSYVKPSDFLQMMMDNADDFEGRPEKLAHRLLILVLAAQHTTSMALCQTLFDLCVRPEYVPLLCEEIEQIIAEDGEVRKPSLTKMKKLDSFLRESQRLSPPSLRTRNPPSRPSISEHVNRLVVGFKRAVRSETVLSDGLVLPKGAHLMMPIYPQGVDAALVESPMEFDGLRHYRARQQPGESNRHQFATTSITNMHFGHGKFACPGRFFASGTIKLLLANLLMKYDFRLVEGQEMLTGPAGRPSHISVHEYVFPNPEAKVEFRLRDRILGQFEGE